MSTSTHHFLDRELASFRLRRRRRSGDFHVRNLGNDRRSKAPVSLKDSSLFTKNANRFTKLLCERCRIPSRDHGNISFARLLIYNCPLLFVQPHTRNVLYFRVVKDKCTLGTTPQGQQGLWLLQIAPCTLFWGSSLLAVRYQQKPMCILRTARKTSDCQNEGTFTGGR
jgi:hypothetical protein